MTQKNKRRWYAFLAVLMIFLLQRAVVHNQKKQASAPGPSPELATPAVTPAPATISPRPAVSTSDTQKQPPPAAGKPVQPTVEPAAGQRPLPPEALIRPANLGKVITVEGVPVNYNTEAALSVAGGTIVWLKGLSPWPPEVVSMRGQQIRVSGVLAEDSGGGAVIWDPSGGKQQMPQGHPVPPGTDLKKLNHRFVMIDATWEALDR